MHQSGERLTRLLEQQRYGVLMSKSGSPQKAEVCFEIAQHFSVPRRLHQNYESDPRTPVHGTKQSISIGCANVCH
jgi:hypothetical protein